MVLADNTFDRIYEFFLSLSHIVIVEFFGLQKKYSVNLELCTFLSHI